MKRYRFIYTICVLLVFINISCSDFWDVEDTNPSYTNEGFYTNENAIREGATGVYSNLYMQVVGELAHTTIFDFYTGLALERNENTTIGAGGGLNADNSDILKFWSQLYTNVARANAFLTGVRPNMDDLSKKSLQYVSEVRVLRAYYYYLLIALWGDVPFYTEPPTSDQYEVEKTSRVKILDFIINECNEATEYLDWIAMDRGRVDKSFAYGLINRMALLGGSLDFGGKSTEYFKIAAEAASKVIGKRLLALNYEDLFVVEGQAKADVRNEMILEMIYNVDGTNVHRNWTGFGFVSRMQGQTSRHPSMLLADTYECIDGKRIDESPLYDGMNTIQELQKLREELIREIDEKFDWIIDEVKKESVPSRQKESRKPRNYEIIYPLNVGAGIFKGKRPTGVIFADGRRTENPTWKSVAEELLKDCCKDSDQRQALMDLRGKVLGRNRVLLGSETGKMRSPVKIDEALYIETHYDAETLMRILTTRILDMVGYDYSKIRIAVKAE